MQQIIRYFHPVTAQSEAYRQVYIEIPPCSALAPYVACFWAPRQQTNHVTADGQMLIVPDACMDIIFTRTSVGLSALYSGLDGTPFYSTAGTPEKPQIFFAVRFHFWAVHLFTGADLRGGVPAAMEALFDGWHAELEGILLANETLPERIHAVETFLLSHLNTDLQSPDLLNAVHGLVHSKGALAIPALSSAACLSQRQLERHFMRHIGVSMKKIAGIVRYQNVWRDALATPRFDVQEAVHRYGYTDQAHLLNTFKRHHGLTLTQALALARCGSDVANLQYNTTSLIV